MKEKTNTPSQTCGDEVAAQRLAEGFTLVPYYGYGPGGRRVPMCRWVRLRPGESMEQAARHLTHEVLGPQG